jgi:hypothetical protein
VARYYRESCCADQDGGGEAGYSLSPGDFLTLENFVQHMDRVVTAAKGPSPRSYHPALRVSFARFKDEIFPRLAAGVKKGYYRLDPLVAWTQIRSFIKGSIETLISALDPARQARQGHPIG